MADLGTIFQGLGVVGSIFGGSSERKQQKKFAQNQIQWRVADAQKAGVHPLAALGLNPISYSPQAVGDYGLGALGQDISRAKMAAMDRRERQAEYAAAAGSRAVERERANVLFAQSVERNQLENDLLRSQIARQNAQLPPPMHGDPQAYRAPTQRFQPQASTPIISSEFDPAREPGNVTSYGYMRTPDGRGLSVTYSDDAKQRTEDDIFAQTDWFIRNRLLPLGRGLTPPDPREYPPGPGRQWTWDATRQAFYPMTEAERRINRRRRREIGAWFERIE